MNPEHEEPPDGWIRTPLPPTRREDESMQGWFARTGVPAPARAPREPEPAPSLRKPAIAILVAGVLFLVGAAAGYALLML